jgi:hypothetical protein
MKAKWLIAVTVLGVLAAGGLYWFQPWKLFTSKTVSDVAPVVATASPSTAPSEIPRTAVLIAKGTLISHEHETSGQVEIVRLPDGKHQLVFRDLSTSDGPDLRVWLTDQPVEPKEWHSFDDGKYVEIGRLKGTHGTLVYDLPAELNPAAYQSVTIWCKRFSVSFGASPLAPA